MNAPAPSPIEAATKHGATFAQADGLFYAIARRRGRPLPLVRFQADTHEAAAAMYCAYFHVRGASS